jgi:lysozyme
MRTPASVLEKIKEFEGCRLSTYPDGGGVLTIGYGSTRNVNLGMTITQEEAEARFLQDVEAAEAAVIRLVKALLTDNQVGALTDFVFNIGLGKRGTKDGFEILAKGGPSTLLSLLNQNRLMDAAQEIEKWVKVSGKPSEALLRRRQWERTLFSTPDSKEKSS